MTVFHPQSAAIAAFLRGVDTRARLVATIHAGSAQRACQAQAAVAQVFASEAGRWPIAQWPRQYWRLLLATPHLRHPLTASETVSGLPLPGIAGLPPLQRIALLLQLVVELDDATAAAALGSSVEVYQQAIRDGLPADALGQPDIDVWRAWRAAVPRALAAQEPDPAAQPAPPAGAPGSGTATAVRPTAAPVAATPPAPVRWLWLGVALCVLAFTATFFLHPAGRAALKRWQSPIKHEALGPAAAPKARFDPAAWAMQPDRELLDAPEEAGYAGQLALLSWLAVGSEDPRAAGALVLPILPASMPRAALSAAAQAQARSRRIRRWEALPVQVRGMQRSQWQAWRALRAGERIRLRGIALRWRALDRVQQQALQARFRMQSADARRGWWLGPTLGPQWPRIAGLFAYVDAGQREALLQLLRDTDPAGFEALARLAQTTPPEARAALRDELLAQAPSQRTAWLLMQLAR